MLGKGEGWREKVRGNDKMGGYMRNVMAGKGEESVNEPKHHFHTSFNRFEETP